LALLPAIAPRFDLTLVTPDGEGSVFNLLPRPASPELRVPIAEARRLAIRSDRGEVEMGTANPSAWATRFGWDRFGLFADFEVGGVTFSLRWIPPGEFVMGSPEDEPGRYSDEGPQHRVTIGRGFWLGATPVTQGQYAAVTGDRPSRFELAGDQAPVERVSWQDSRDFCRTLAEKVTDFDTELSFRLPSEAEWEYACRAGTTSALYTGPLTIKGERNGPELDSIAWYGGNSGVDYEGGYDSSDWPEKQYEHNRAGTHPVGEKDPNPWGLYDMLGNVWEWCQDVWHDNYEGAPSDDSAWGVEGGSRVHRGGGWLNRARDCRCAYRGYWGPGDCSILLGFRLVLAPRATGDAGPFS
jgi:formylglycine-generating enzyme required for sulfatase activity